METPPSNTLATQSSIYEPVLNQDQQYVDKVPSTHVLNAGIRCECSKRNTIFKTRTQLTAHFATNQHKAWLDNCNNNKKNHFTENIQLTELVSQQRLLIAERDRKILQLENQIRHFQNAMYNLSMAYGRDNCPQVNLLDIDG